MNGDHGQHVPGSAPPTTPDTPYFPSPGETSGEERNMAMLCHLLAIFTGFIGPLIIWLIHRNKSHFVDAHGRAVLNFSLSLMIYSFALMLLMVGLMMLAMAGGASGQGATQGSGAAAAGGIISACFAYIVMIGLGVFGMVMEIIHCVQATRGGFSRYPLALPLLYHSDPFEPAGV